MDRRNRRGRHFGPVAEVDALAQVSRPCAGHEHGGLRNAPYRSVSPTVQALPENDTCRIVPCRGHSLLFSPTETPYTAVGYGTEGAVGLSRIGEAGRLVPIPFLEVGLCWYFRGESARRS
jgi:hypothetical protein